jgi:hypothetical protein
MVGRGQGREVEDPGSQGPGGKTKRRPQRYSPFTRLFISASEGLENTANATPPIGIEHPSRCGSNARTMKIDGFVKSKKPPFSVIPVKTGIQEFQALLNSRLRGSDNLGDFLRVRQSLLLLMSFSHQRKRLGYSPTKETSES